MILAYHLPKSGQAFLTGVFVSRDRFEELAKTNYKAATMTDPTNGNLHVFRIGQEPMVFMTVEMELNSGRWPGP